jgi:hypothetical protein
MLKKPIKLVCGTIGLIILASACNMGQIVIQQTVVVTATLSATQTPSNVPTLVPTNTSVPPTVPPPAPATKPPPPKPTLPQLVVEAIPGQLKARIVHPDYFNGAKTSLTFQVQAYDPQVGNKDGAGIKNVEFHILDSNGNEVLKQVEQNVPYCSFGGDNPCPVWVFAAHGNKWPSGQPIQNGTYTLQVNIHAQNSDNDENDEIQFDIQIGK